MRAVYLAALLIIVIMLPQNVFAATWRVEQDGSGDFDDIQPAVDAAAEGDTIRIGPGHYDQAHSVLIPQWEQETDVYVYVDKERLTFIGSGRDEVVIGPDVYYQTYFGPNGFATGDLTQVWYVENVTLQNLWGGVYDEGGVQVRNCRIIGCQSAGLYKYSHNGIQVEDCVFENNPYGGVLTSSANGVVEIRNCEFDYSSISLQGTAGVIVENCTMAGGSGPGGSGGIQFDNSSGVVSGCTMRSFTNFGIVGIFGADISVSNCDIQVDGNALWLSNSSLVADACVIRGGIYQSILVGGLSSLIVNNSDIYRAGELYIKCNAGDPCVHDATGNYWNGAESADDIAAGIWDANDTEDTPMVIDFTPFSDQPLPTEDASWGDLKAMYLGGR